MQSTRRVVEVWTCAIGFLKIWMSKQNQRCNRAISEAQRAAYLAEIHIPQVVKKMNETADEAKKGIEITTADWLKSGWVFALREGGGMHVSRIGAGKEQGAKFAEAILNAVENLHVQNDAAGIIISPEDAAIVSEYFPEHFRKTRSS